MTDATVVAGVDLHAVASWMDAQGLGTGAPIGGAEPIAGGTQNVLLRFERAGRTYVLRRPPEHKRRNSDETMRREARVLAALAASDVPHPALIASCPDVDVIGAAFYLMEPVDGFNPSMGMPDPAWQRDIGLSMADAIAAVGRVDIDATGLRDLGKADGWLERQVDRWRSHLASYAELDGYRGPDVPGVEAVAAWLDEHRPASWRAGLIHGDFHLANVLVHHDRPQLAAIVDWELTTIGDPLLDLGHMLVTWPSGASPEAHEIVERYAQGSDRDLSSIDWYRVLACYRLGIILEGTNARADAGLAPRAIGDMLHAMTVGLFEQALRLIG